MDNNVKIALLHSLTSLHIDVALTVGVGSYQDPIDFPGLAHFVEHCVFLGNEKYPEQNGLDSLIN